MFFYDWIRSLLVYLGFKKNAKLLIMGLDNAGKSTLLAKLSCDGIVQHFPTTTGSCEVDIGAIRCTLYNFSHPQVRRICKNYHSAVEGIIFMVDCVDHTRFDEARDELDRTIRDVTLSDAPIAVLFNKIDRKEAFGEEYLTAKLNLAVHRTGKDHKPRAELAGRPLETFPSSIVKYAGYGDALRWLAYYVK